MQFTTSVTQKGQITIPKDIRDKLKLEKYDTVMISQKDQSVVITKVKDILDLAGTIKLPKHLRNKDTRALFEKSYERI